MILCTIEWASTLKRHAHRTLSTWAPCFSIYVRMNQSTLRVALRRAFPGSWAAAALSDVKQVSQAESATRLP